MQSYDDKIVYYRGNKHERGVGMTLDTERAKKGKVDTRTMSDRGLLVGLKGKSKVSKPNPLHFKYIIDFETVYSPLTRDRDQIAIVTICQ